MANEIKNRERKLYSTALYLAFFICLHNDTGNDEKLRQHIGQHYGLISHLEMRVFVNAGHVCGGIVHVETKDDILPADANDFFSLFNPGTDDERWHQIAKR